MSWKTVSSGRWTIDGEPDTEKTAPLAAPVVRKLNDVFEIDHSEWATNGIFTVYRKEWTPTTFTYEVFVYGGRVHVASNLDIDLQAFLKGEYDRHVEIDFDEYFEKGQWYDATAPIWYQGGALC